MDNEFIHIIDAGMKAFVVENEKLVPLEVKEDIYTRCIIINDIPGQMCLFEDKDGREIFVEYTEWFYFKPAA